MLRVSELNVKLCTKVVKQTEFRGCVVYTE